MEVNCVCTVRTMAFVTATAPSCPMQNSVTVVRNVSRPRAIATFQELAVIDVTNYCRRESRATVATTQKICHGARHVMRV